MKLINYIENTIFKLGITKPYTWDRLVTQEYIQLYAGQLTPEIKQFKTHIGLNPTPCSRRTIIHDICNPFPLANNSIESFQSEDVFEHIEYNLLANIFNEIHRILKPNGLFRLSVPDYRFDIYRNRSLKNEQGEILFDPLGGGRFINQKVIDGGHIWFPTLEKVLAIFDNSYFTKQGKINILHAYGNNDDVFLKPIDYTKGYIKRTPDHDGRGMNPYRPVSIVIDAIKY